MHTKGAISDRVGRCVVNQGRTGWWMAAEDGMQVLCRNGGEGGALGREETATPSAAAAPLSGGVQGMKRGRRL